MEDISNKPRKIDIKWLRDNLRIYMHQYDVSGARSFIENVSLKIRRKITQPSVKSGCHALGLLYTAVSMNNVMFIRFYVEECNADLEGKFDKPYLRRMNRDEPTPLWAAVRDNNIEAVEELIRLGANVNVVARSEGVSILHEACRRGCLSTATCLINNGANVMKRDKDGFTALMRAIKNVDICRLLIENGASINDINKFGNSALHYAVDAGQAETVKLFLDSGADILLKNETGDNSLHYACIHCASDVVEVMRDHLSRNDVRRQVEAHWLLGACYITDDFADAMTKAFNEWKAALQLREDKRYRPIVVAEDLVSPPNPAYDNATEIDSMLKLNEIRHDENMMYMQSLLLQEKILGPTHETTISSLIDRGNFCLDNEDYGRGLRLLRRAFEFSCDHWFQYRTFWFEFDFDWSAELNLNVLKTRLDFQDVYEFLETVTFQAKRVANAEKSAVKNAVKKFRLELKLCCSEILCQLIRLFSHVMKNEDQVFQFKKLVHDFIRLNLRFERERTLLMNIIYTQNTDFIMSNVVGVDIVKLLLDCGADAGQRNVSGNSALHLLALKAGKRFDFSDDKKKQMAEMLLASGAHYDARNKKRFSCVRFLKGLDIDLSTHMTLQCLAAQVIRRKKIPCEGILSKCLLDFVEMH